MVLLIFNVFKLKLNTLSQLTLCTKVNQQVHANKFKKYLDSDVIKIILTIKNN